MQMITRCMLESNLHQRLLELGDTRKTVKENLSVLDTHGKTPRRLVINYLQLVIPGCRAEIAYFTGLGLVVRVLIEGLDARALLPPPVAGFLHSRPGSFSAASRRNSCM